MRPTLTPLVFPEMWPIADEFKVRIGGNTYVNTPNVIVAVGESLFRIRRRQKDGILAVDFDIYDSAGKKLAEIRYGHIVTGSAKNYEIRTEQHRYRVIERNSGRTICDVRQVSKAKGASELEVSVDLFTKTGFHLVAGPERTNVRGLTSRGLVVERAGAGLVVQ